MNGNHPSKLKKRAAALAVASCLSLAHLGAEAAGLGKLTVLSALGQPLRAELDVGASRDELVGMTAKLAAQAAFRQAGVDYSPVLGDLRFSIDKRANGASVILVSSSKPINEPFLDFLVELNWPAGRLIREYTFLLDPPDVRAKQAAPVVAEAKVIDGVNVPETTVRSARVRPRITAENMPSAPTPAPSNEPQEAAAQRLVKTGDTLRKIASEAKYEEVSLEQMLVALYRKNPDAFLGHNIHRLKSGAILAIPDKESVAAISDAEAKKVYVSHTGDWHAYRQKLAAAAPAAAAREEAGQASSGRITAKVDDKAPAADEGRDQVRVSRTELAGKGAKPAAAEADLIAREKALKEAQERLALLEKNVGELQKLLEMKNQRLADLQQQLARKDEIKPVEAPKPAPEPVKPVATESTPVAKPVDAKVEEPAKPAEPVKAEEPAKPAEAPKPPPARMPPPPPEPEPEAEPDFVASLLEDPTVLAGGGGIAVLLLGYALYRRRRQQPDQGLATTMGGDGTAYPMSGGQSIDTGNTPPQTGEFSQTGPGTIDTDEVDPVAEADVYMAYGRDAQAEEILLEALLKDQHRIAIHLKLLEIYAQRRSLKQFETLAGDVYAQTGGQGPDWDKVAALGVAIDPGNPLYSGAQPAVTPLPFNPDATLVVTPENHPQHQEVSEAPSLPSLSEAPAAELAVPDDEPMSLDFDLGELAAAPTEVPTEAPALDVVPEVSPEPAAVADDNLLDFDLGELDLPTAPVETEVPLAVSEQMLDFDLDLPEPEPEEMPVLASEAPQPTTPELALTLEIPPAVTALPEVPVVPTLPPLELSIPEISLDLAEPVAVTSAPAADDFDLALDLPDLPVSEAPLAATAEDDLALDFGLDALPSVAPDSEAPAAEPVLDFDLDLDVPATEVPLVVTEAPLPDFDLTDLNLDLGVPDVAAVASGDAERDARWEEVNTKLDLAKAYEEMGDMEGARELLNEVVGEGSPDLVAQALDILGRIGKG